MDPVVPAVRTFGLSKAYRERVVLSHVTLDVPPGERFCLVGRNGSGKSTLIELIVGLKRPSDGTIEVFGQPPWDPRLKRQCAILMDRPVFPYYARVKEIVWLYAGFYAAPLDGATLIRLFELDPEQFVRHLSKGQIQRLGMLLALLGDPKLILLDEPSAGLDQQGRVLLWDTLHRSLSGNTPRTLIFATHDLAEAERWANQVGVLHEGRLMAVSSPVQLCERVIGTRRKLTLIGQDRVDDTALDGRLVRSTARIGTELALYTDAPEELLRRLSLTDPSTVIRIENVSLRDVYFRLTGEVTDDAPAVAH